VIEMHPKESENTGDIRSGDGINISYILKMLVTFFPDHEYQFTVFVFSQF